MLENKKVSATIDDDEWSEFKDFCKAKGVSYKTIYDYDEGVLVSIFIHDLIDFQSWLNGDRGEEEEDYYVCVSKHELKEMDNEA